MVGLCRKGHMWKSFWVGLTFVSPNYIALWTAFIIQFTMLPLGPHPLPVSHYTDGVAVLNTNIQYVQAFNKVLTSIIKGTSSHRRRREGMQHIDGTVLNVTKFRIQILCLALSVGSARTIEVKCLHTLSKRVLVDDRSISALL